MSWTLTTSGSAIVKAGAGVSTDIVGSGSVLLAWCNEAEGRIESETRRSWVDNYSGLSTGIQNLLSDIASSLIAKKMISFDISNYLNPQEAYTLINIQDDIAKEGLRILKDFKSNELRTP